MEDETELEWAARAIREYDTFMLALSKILANPNVDRNEILRILPPATVLPASFHPPETIKTVSAYANLPERAR